MKPWAAFVLTVVLAAAGFGLLDEQVGARQRQDEMADTMRHLSDIRARLEVSLSSNLFLTRGLTAYVLTHPDLTDRDFADLSKHLLDGSTSVHNLSLARGTVISAVYPVAGNEKAIGNDYLAVPHQRDVVVRAIETGLSVIAGPVNLLQGGTAFIGRSPIFVGEGEERRFWGLVSIIIDMPAVFRDAGLSEPTLKTEVAIRGRDGLGAKGDVFYGRNELFNPDESVLMDVILPGGFWQLAGAPRQGWESVTPERMVFRGMAIGISLLAGILALVGTRQIRQERAARLLMRASEERFRLVVSGTNDGIWDWNLESGIVYYSPRWCESLGIAADAASGGITEWLDRIHADERSAIERALALHVNGETEHFETVHRLRHADGSYLWVINRGRMVRDAGGQPSCMVGACTDITAQKRVEQQLETQTKRLAQSNAELEQFAYLASHDLREPLRTVSSFVSLLERRYAHQLDDNAREFIAYARNGAMRMDRLVQDLLQYSRLGQAGRPFALVSMDQVVEAVLHNLAGYIGETGATITIEGTMPTVMGDRSELARLLQNLVGNALKYRAADCPPEIRINVERVVNEWLFRVQDNGIGIAEEHYERIWKIFRRLHTASQYEGTGIGLAVCKKVVEQHGGRIWVSSVPHAGSCFHFTLPAAAVMAANDVETQRPSLT